MRTFRHRLATALERDRGRGEFSPLEIYVDDTP
jgi:hypothetical protein